MHLAKKFSIVLTLSLTLGAISTGTAKADGPIFDQSDPRTISPTDFPKGFAVGDVDGDNDYDVVTVHNLRSDRLGINDGDGYFTSRSLGNTDNRWGNTLLIDYDRDGDLDIFIIGQLSDVSSLFWYINDGSGNLTVSPGIETYREAFDMGDLNGDGFPDIVIGAKWNQYYHVPSVYFNDQAGGFTLAQDFPPQIYYGEGVRLGDVDGDKDLDCAVSDRLWLNDGSGHFADSGQDLRTGDSIGWEREFADIDKDGDLDLLIAEINYGSYVLLNNGAGVFTWTGERLATALDVAVADINADGTLDVCTGGFPGGVAAVYVGNGTGYFSDAIQTIPNGPECANSIVGFADIDGDSREDLIMSCALRDTYGRSTAFINITGPAIPTVSEWGLVVMSLLVLTAGTLVYARRRPVHA